MELKPIEIKKKEKRYGAKVPNVPPLPEPEKEPVKVEPERISTHIPDPIPEPKKPGRKWVKKEPIVKSEQPLPDSIIQAASRRVLDWQKVDEMLSIGCDAKEIANYFGVSVTLLKNNCLRETGIKWEQREGEGIGDLVLKLRSAQWKKALGWSRIEVVKDRNGFDVVDKNGNKVTKTTYYPPDTQMQMHLGKYYLGQKDSLEIKHLYEGYVFVDEEGNDTGEFADYEEINNNPGVIEGVALISLDD